MKITLAKNQRDFHEMSYFFGKALI